MAIINTTTREEFETNVVKSDKVVLVDFWAPWCPPCRMMAPILEDLAKKMDADIDVVKVDIESGSDNKVIAGEHKVQGIPNMQIYKNGEVVDELIGMRAAPVLEDELKKHIG